MLSPKRILYFWWDGVPNTSIEGYSYNKFTSIEDVLQRRNEMWFPMNYQKIYNNL